MISSFTFAQFRILAVVVVGGVFMSVGSAFSLTPVVVACGTAVMPNEVGIVTEDLQCSGSDPAVRVIGPATLLLSGFTIDCEDLDAVGIQLEGEKATVKGGLVTGCDNGVRVEGVGNHIIIDMTSKENDSDGFQNSGISHGNTYLNNKALRNKSDGFCVFGNNHEFLGNLAKGTEGDGFDIFDDGHHFANNVAENNQTSGFFVGGTSHKLANNIANRNLEDGFFINNTDNELINNTATRNGLNGFKVQGSRNDFARNIAKRNQANGVTLDEGAEDNKLLKNKAQGNAILDLEDNNFSPPCDGNIWAENEFGSRNQACIR